MTITTSIPVKRTTQSRLSTVDFSNLGFGNYISDHMLVAKYDNGAWQEPQIIPYGDLLMSPAMLSLHYGQAVFEGMKAFHMQDGSINVFRVERHHKRLNKSLARMCMPAISEELFTSGIEAVVKTDEAWIPKDNGSSLYIRPVVFASEAKLGVKVADQYLFVILTSPVGPYFSKPVRLKVELEYVRAAEGGTGFAKCAGNYGGAFYPTQQAREQGFDQVIWTDAKEHKYIDESGAMNIMFVIDNKLVTPALSSSILDGVTRNTLITLAKDMGVTVEERKISIEEIEKAFQNKTIAEAFGAGTAAVVSPIATITINGIDYHLPEVNENGFQLTVKRKLHNIRSGAAPDKYNWNHIIK
ncbi:MAG: branched-chain amino acid aminotransferase [Cyclobacteriaceae bacterium]|nr:branched-chain amino acid aminotransferase [Cyclobacteriaceae bacterium]